MLPSGEQYEFDIKMALTQILVTVQSSAMFTKIFETHKANNNNILNIFCLPNIRYTYNSLILGQYHFNEWPVGMGKSKMHSMYRDKQLKT